MTSPIIFVYAPIPLEHANTSPLAQAARLAKRRPDPYIAQVVAEETRVEKRDRAPMSEVV